MNLKPSVQTAKRELSVGFLAECILTLMLARASPAITVLTVLVLLIVTATGSAQRSSPFVELDRADRRAGYLASLLINEVPFPGERAYESEANTRDAMLQILWVLHSRIYQIPPGYIQREVAGVQSREIIDVITGTGGRRQCEGNRFFTLRKVSR